MNEKGEMEDIRTMETRTCRKWSAAEKKEYHSLRQQLTSEHMRGGSLGQKWRAQCICWEEKGCRPKSGVRADDSVQRLRQQGWIWDVEDVEGARRAPACWGGWEYRVRWTGWNVAWEKGGGRDCEPRYGFWERRELCGGALLRSQAGRG